MRSEHFEMKGKTNGEDEKFKAIKTKTKKKREISLRKLETRDLLGSSINTSKSKTIYTDENFAENNFLSFSLVKILSRKIWKRKLLGISEDETFMSL